jgi:ABC-2 type transport system ATP-binding protein
MSTTTVDLPSAQFDDTSTGQVVHLSHVGKRFGEMVAVQDVSLTVERGHIFGMIGPSGCGKTTVVRIMAGLVKPTMGTVLTLGKDPTELGSNERTGIGYMPQGFVLYPSLSVLQNARFIAGLYGVSWFHRGKRIRELLERFDLWEARGRKARDLSGGMQRRLQLACALIHGPELLFVDEPTAGLDPVLRVNIWSYLNSLRDEGMTIVMTTQLIDEAEHCDKLVLINNGHVAHIGTPDELRRLAMPGDTLDVHGGPFPPDVEHVLGELDQSMYVRRMSENLIHMNVHDVASAIPAVVSALEHRGVRIDSVVPQSVSLDEAFTKLVADDA